jgi:hypothetical protein
MQLHAVSKMAQQLHLIESDKLACCQKAFYPEKLLKTKTIHLKSN